MTMPAISFRHVVLVPHPAEFTRVSCSLSKCQTLRQTYEKDITLDDCENVTRSLNDFLDELIPVKYYLEVSSPGLERKFKSDKEFLIFKGRRISLKLKTPLEGESEKIFKGEILDWDENEGLKFFRFDDGQELQIPKSNIQSAKLYID